jgi:hypothetical protein
MDKKKSHQWNFAMEAMPILFHSQTNGFMKYIDKDGVEFLKFWWNHVGDQLDESKRVSPAGLTFDVEQIDPKTRLVTITLPTPKEDGDPYFLGMVARPERRFSLVRIPNTNVFVLKRADSIGQAHLTSFGELTPRALYRERGIGLAPVKQDFKRIVKKRLEPKKKVEKK